MPVPSIMKGSRFILADKVSNYLGMSEAFVGQKCCKCNKTRDAHYVLDKGSSSYWCYMDGTQISYFAQVI